MRFVRALIAACVIALAVAPAAFAQILTMSSDFPSVVADPGARVSFPIKITTDVAERIDLTVAGQPGGWTTTLRGGGSTIAAVTTHSNPDVAGEFSATFTAEVQVPDTVGAGNNDVVIEGRTAAGATSRLVLTVITEEQEPGSVSLTSNSPNKQGSASTSFSFDLTLRNDTNTQQAFTLETAAPAGWQVDARPSGDAQAATAIVDAGATATIQVTARPPTGAPAGDNQILVRAVSGPYTAEAALSVTITGSYSMDLSTTDGRLNARVSAGNPTQLNLIVTNSGTAPIEDLEINSTPPSRWTVTFSPETLTTVAPNSTVPVTATITPASDALAGDYTLIIRASSDNANDSVEIRTTVETSPLGYIIGIGVLIAVAAGLFLVFQRYGRR